MEQGSPPVVLRQVVSKQVVREPSNGVAERTFGILDMVRGAVDVCSVPAGDRGVDEWMGVLGEVSQALTVLAAARDAAIVRLAAIDEVVTEDGVIDEQVNGLGTVCLDAGAMVSTATGTSARFGEEMVEQAVTRVVRVPALHEAMLEGALDDYKARRLADELNDVPPDLARAIVDALAGELSTKSGPALQRKARTILMSLCPDLLRERIRRARKGVGLRRWMGEPGTDSWGGSFPSERAATAWAAVDALARRYRQEGTYDTLEQARAYALMDLVDGKATVETTLHLTVPRDALEEATRCAAEAVASPASHTGVHGHGHVAAKSGGASSLRPRSAHIRGEGTASDATFVGVAGAQGRSISWFPVTTLTSCSGDADPVEVYDPWTGALLDAGDRLATQAYRPGESLKTLVRRRDGGCRFPGCSISSRQCDIDHVVPWPHGPTAASNLICLCRRHHRIKQRHRWRVRLFADGAVEWVDPTGRLHRTGPVDLLGAREARVVSVGPAEVWAGDADRESTAPAGLGSSCLESWLAIHVEHATGGMPTARGPSSTTDGLEGHRRPVLSGEEIDELSRGVRVGTFATFGDALRSRSSPLTGSPGNTSTCRVDHHLAPRGHIVTVRPRSHHRRTHDPPATVDGPPF